MTKRKLRITFELEGEVVAKFTQMQKAADLSPAQLAASLVTEVVRDDAVAHQSPYGPPLI